MTFINAIGTHNPSYKYKQEEILTYMLSHVPDLEERSRRGLQMIYKRSGIGHRYSVLPDFGESNQERLFSSNALDKMPAVEKRMAIFDQEATNLGIEAIKKCIPDAKLADITHIVTVSCTGMSAPGIDIDLVQKLNLRPDIVRTTVNFMGCYAAFHALRIAHQICCTEKNAQVLIVDIELCTLHFQNYQTEDHITANAIFADGAAAVWISAQELPEQKPIFKIKNFHSMLSLKGRKEMAWNISSEGFLMTLSSYVANIIEEDLDNLLLPALAKDFPDHDASMIQWAIHPGGKKILEKVQKSLNISSKEIDASYKVLHDFGNMSSATILFVLQEIATKVQKKEKPIFATGFGPGLTMEAMTLLHY